MTFYTVYIKKIDIENEKLASYHPVYHSEKITRALEIMTKANNEKLPIEIKVEYTDNEEYCDIYIG